MNQLISVYELMNLYSYHNSYQKTSPEYTLKLQNQQKTTFFLLIVIQNEVISSALTNNDAANKAEVTWTIKKQVLLMSLNV